MADDGPDATTVKAVMARAGVGPGSFYARFDSRAALMGFVQERFWTRCASDLRQLTSVERWDGIPVSTVAPEIVRRLVRGHARHEAHLRAILVEALRRPDGQAMERVVEMDDALLEALAQLIDRDGGHADASRAALLQLMGALRNRVLFPDEAPFRAGFLEEDLILELSRTLLRAVEKGHEAPGTYAELLCRSAGIRPASLSAG
jgi:AcrR family transcriptional regulator